MATATKHTIEIAYNHHEGTEFVAWLNEQGHTATLGNDSGNYINGENVDNDENISEAMTALWDAYCNS